MFDENFYPTPEKVVEKMIKNLNWDLLGQRILEPSAGKGDIFDSIKSLIKYGLRKSEFFCIEKNKDLQAILKEKEYILLDSDFLNYEADKRFTLIIMNPPFDKADKHFIKAFDISLGAEIRCLYPTESINNPYSKERKLVLDIIENNNGNIENLGNCFIDSERKTNVDVSLISIPYNFKKYDSEMKFDNFVKDDFIGIDGFKNEGLEILDITTALVNRYKKTISVYREFLQKKEELKFYFKGLVSNDLDNFLKESTTGNTNETLEMFTNKFKAKAWEKVFYSTKVQNMLTSNIQKDFEKFISSNKNIAFNEENIEHLIKELFLNGSNIMLKCILDCFDTMTKYHEENRVYFEGWKTNKSWKVTKKFILPRALNDLSCFGISLNYSMREIITDIEKTMCYIISKKWGDIQSITNTFDSKIMKEKLQFNVWLDSEFFEFKIFKKGTMHLSFKDDELHKKFNLIACRGKNWLPPEQPKKESPKDKPMHKTDIKENNECTQLALF